MFLWWRSKWLCFVHRLHIIDKQNTKNQLNFNNVRYWDEKWKFYVRKNRQYLNYYTAGIVDIRMWYEFTVCVSFQRPLEMCVVHCVRIYVANVSQIDLLNQPYAVKSCICTDFLMVFPAQLTDFPSILPPTFYGWRIAFFEIKTKAFIKRQNVKYRNMKFCFVIYKSIVLNVRNRFFPFLSHEIDIFNQIYLGREEA